MVWPTARRSGREGGAGWVKLITDANYGEILGAHLVGPDVTELLPELTMAQRLELTPAAIAARQAFLSEERWLAANSHRSTPNELEYQIEVIDDTLRLAVNVIRSSNPDMKPAWPADLDDDCTLPTPGDLPPQMHFDPDQWATIGIPLSDR